MSQIAVNGIKLNVEVSGQGPPLLLLHGFTGSTVVWQPFLEDWPDFRLIRVDVIGHGLSDCPVDASRYSMTQAVADLVAVLDHLGVQRTALLGYSMGGRLALHFALAAPQRLAALVLESASAGIESEPERAARRASDEALAADIESQGLEAFADRWQALPLFASQQRLPAEVLARQRQRRVASSAPGLANSLRGMGTGTQEYLLPRLSELRLPVLLLAGEADARYASLTREMQRLIPGSRAEVVPEAGHAVHLEQPEIYAGLVGEFLRHQLKEREL